VSEAVAALAGAALGVLLRVSGVAVHRDLRGGLDVGDRSPRPAQAGGEITLSRRK